MPITDHLKFSPDILRRLGEELNPHPDQGILELVRNSYDADARTCSVELFGTDAPGGTIRVTDDGAGMTIADIRDGWLVVGKSGKSGRGITNLGRIPVGDKGLGRLAALRMGNFAHLSTRPAEQPGTEYRVLIDWSDFDNATVVEDVPFRIDETPTDKPPGTDVEVRRLNPRLGRRDVQRLARSLLLLADPFNNEFGFKPRLVAPAFRDLEKRVKEAYFDQAEFHLVAELDREGRAGARVLDWKSEELWSAEQKDLSKERYAAPATKFDLWAFLLDAKTFSTRTTSVGEVQDWLKVVGGVHLYHRGLRVQPYGDPGHDWLEMNLRRAQSPELRPSTNTSIGIVNVIDGGDLLIPKTDRSGFVENEAFSELRRFFMDALDWMSRRRMRAREQARQRERTQSPKSVDQAKTRLNKALDEVPSDARAAVGKAVQSLERARERETRNLREELQLYRTLATVGTSTAVFAHQSAKPSSQIERLAQTVRTRARSALGDSYSNDLDRPIELIVRSAHSLQTVAELPLYLLNRDKRRSGRVEINRVIREICDVFEPFLSARQISVDFQLTDVNPVLRGTVAALEGIVANLLTNAVSAFVSLDGRSRGRLVRVCTEISGKNVLLRVLDSGPGIKNISTDDIWLPGQTTIPGGTGLGLTIVRDSALDLGGDAYAIPNGELGGAEFVVNLPMLE